MVTTPSRIEPPFFLLSSPRTSPRAWEESGGVATRYDNRLDGSRDFANDGEYWDYQIQNPADIYHFAPPCTNLSRAHTTPVVRTPENPYGDEADPEVRACNDLVRLLVRRVKALVRAGACVVIENPLGSYL